MTSTVVVLGEADAVPWNVTCEDVSELMTSPLPRSMLAYSVGDVEGTLKRRYESHGVMFAVTFLADVAVSESEKDCDGGRSVKAGGVTATVSGALRFVVLVTTPAIGTL